MKKQLNDSGKSDFFSQMNTLLGAGLDLSGTFEILLEENREEGVRAMIERIYDEVIVGASLASALHMSGQFSAMDCGVVGVGEISGKLPQTMDFLSDYYARKDAHSKMIRSALTYPLMILAFAFAVLVFMILVIVPVFGSIYSRMGSELPGITRWMMALSDNALPALVICVSFVVLAAGVYLKFRYYERFDRARCRLLIGTPFVGRLVRTDAQCTFCRLMSLLTVSGVSMMESLELAAQSMTILSYREAFTTIMDSVKRGGTLAGAMSEYQNLFDSRILSIIRIGEESNRLPGMFAKASDICSGRLEQYFKRIQTWLEPVMIVFVGIVVAVILVSMYLPMFKMGMTLLGE